MDAMLKVVERYNGIRLKMPIKAKPNHPLNEVIETSQFQALVDWFGGEEIDMPKLDSVIMQIKHQRVYQLRDEGLKVADIALRLNYCERRIRQLLAQRKASHRNQGCFDF